MKRLSLALCLALVCAMPAFAQIEGGSISGTLSDVQGGVLPGAEVTAAGTDATQTFITDAEGAYRFLNLPPGTYTISAALQGFTALTRENVVVAVGRNVLLPLTLEVGSITETVVVTTAAPLVDPRPIGTATNFTAGELTKIPTSRDPFSLMRTVPGVLLDRVNVGGNETGQAPTVVSKGTRPQDTVWTLDGVVITDMAAIGQPPTYFNFDNFEEIHVATAGQDIRQQTGGLGVNLVTKRGTNAFHGSLRGYFNNDAIESTNVPDELAAMVVPVTADTADHTKQIADAGGDIGGPLLKDRAWFYASYSVQDIRLVRRAGALVDRTKLKNPSVKVNWQATKKDNVNFLFFNGSKIKEGRSPGFPGILFDAPTATFRQDNAYSDFPLHGLWKIGDDRTIGSNLFLSAKYAYYNTGNLLSPMGSMDVESGRSLITGQSYGSTVQTLNIRPQQTVNVDASSFINWLGAAHDVKFGFGYRTSDTVMKTEWPGNGILALENSATDFRAQVFRQGNGANRVNYLDFYVGDTLALGRATIDLGLRYDRQWGVALPSVIEGSKAFPDLVPGLTFPGYDAPFVWNNLSPRAGITYAIDEDRKTVARATYSRFAGQLNSTAVGYVNPSSNAGFATYRWVDANGDHLAQAGEVLTDQRLTQGGGFNPTAPTAVTSANQIDPNLKAPVTQSVVGGLERELRPHLAAHATYTYTRTNNLFGNLTANITPRTGVTLADYSDGPILTGTLPDGTSYSVPTYVADGAKVIGGGLGFRIQTVPGYSTDYHGLEFGLVKRLSDRWMGRVAFSLNNAREHFDDPAGVYDTNGNPTPTITEPLIDGGQFAPQSAASSGAGSNYLNSRWQFNANGMYVAPYAIEVSANVFGRQGYPFPLYRAQALGGESLNVHVTPRVDYFRYANLWTTDARVARSFRVRTTEIRLLADVFNLFNANTVLVRNNNIAATTFNQIAQNLSPRIFRVGVVVGF
jgi:hypothetical protein